MVFVEHSGVCTDYGGGTIQCDCRNDYGGDLCEVLDEVDHCAIQDGEACANGGSCIDLFGEYECECAQGYGGITCEHHDTVNDCESGEECNNHGSCTDSFFGFECACEEGWGGTECTTQEQTSSDPCLSSPCLNNGKHAQARTNTRCWPLSQQLGFGGLTGGRLLFPGVCEDEWFGNDYSYACTCQPGEFQAPASLLPCRSRRCRSISACEHCATAWTCPPPTPPHLGAMAGREFAFSAKTCSNSCKKLGSDIWLPDKPRSCADTIGTPAGEYGTHCENVESADQCLEIECCATGGVCTDLFNEAFCECNAGAFPSRVVD